MKEFFFRKFSIIYEIFGFPIYFSLCFTSSLLKSISIIAPGLTFFISFTIVSGEGMTPNSI